MYRKLDITKLHTVILKTLKEKDVNAGFELIEKRDKDGNITIPLKFPASVLEFTNATPDDTKTSFGMNRYLLINIIDDYDSNIRIYEELEKIYSAMSEKIRIDGFTVDLIKMEENGPSDDNSFIRMEVVYEIKIYQLMEE
ncbi:hypothetical protein [Listeria monocytogenes]|uniref:hypothetical protein n=1 Tax=Listeria monocytogenes TaxID=1639 RepID=UPI0012776111|nr:hypothetical protein [Listeria monocytogenes]EAG0857694.1 hypothetical protein [Listeria monocytogenes]EAG4620057.1 hypothetical protein [Listeria monocytogenes]EDN9533434.1 hypothetical protein [Listeria monocytogenes]EDN9536241.1 hypothetical protein [Listeria monocytogenes]